QLGRPSRRREIDSELVDDRSLGAVPGLLLPIGARLVQHVVDLLAHLVQAHAEAFQYARRDPLAFANQTEQQMLGPNVVVVETPSFLNGKLDHLLRTWSEADLSRDHPLAAAYDELDSTAHFVEVYTQ